MLANSATVPGPAGNANAKVPVKWHGTAWLPPAPLAESTDLWLSGGAFSIDQPPTPTPATTTRAKTHLVIGNGLLGVRSR